MSNTLNLQLGEGTQANLLIFTKDRVPYISVHSDNITWFTGDWKLRFGLQSLVTESTAKFKLF